MNKNEFEIGDVVMFKKSVTHNNFSLLKTIYIILSFKPYIDQNGPYGARCLDISTGRIDTPCLKSLKKIRNKEK